MNARHARNLRAGIMDARDDMDLANGLAVLTRLGMPLDVARSVLGQASAHHKGKGRQHCRAYKHTFAHATAKLMEQAGVVPE